MNAFVTGSRVYSTPREDSDIDLIVLLSSYEDILLLEELSELGKQPIKFGRLNLIVTESEARFNCWKEGTEYLKSQKPVDRDEAIKYFNGLFESKGLPKFDNESGE